MTNMEVVCRILELVIPGGAEKPDKYPTNPCSSSCHNMKSGNYIDCIKQYNPDCEIYEKFRKICSEIYKSSKLVYGIGFKKNIKKHKIKHFMIGRNMFIPNNKEVDRILEIFNYSPEYLKTISKLLYKKRNITWETINVVLAINKGIHNGKN